MNVLTAAWTATGAPVAPHAPGVAGACARCAEVGDLVSVRGVISKTFTGFDDWVDPNGPGVCSACAWGYSTPALRVAPHLIVRDPAAIQELSRVEVGLLLQRGGLEPGLAVVVPLRPGRKHVLPAAEWGRVSIEDAQLPWRDRDAGLLQLVVDLRDRGFGTRMLIEPAPPFQVLQTLPRCQWAQVMRLWNRLAPWRTPDNPWLALALRVTTPTSAKEAS